MCKHIRPVSVLSQFRNFSILKIIYVFFFIAVWGTFFADIRLKGEIRRITQAGGIALFDINPIPLAPRNGMTQVPLEIEVDKAFFFDQAIHTEIDFRKGRLRRCKHTERFMQKVLRLQTLLPFRVLDILRFCGFAVLEDDRACVIAPDVPGLRA